jgi:tetratricopeptide (TPR) repeat protein
VDFIAHLLPPYETAAKVLYEEANQQVFIKTLPNGRIALHDEMRRLINTYVWPEVDLDGDRRRREARRAANYLTQELKEIRAQIQRLKQEPLTIRVEQQIDALERAFWTLELDRVRYTLESDWQEGVHTFAEVFDRAGLDVRAPLLHIVGERVEQARRRGSYDRETRYIYEIRLIKQKLRSLDLEEGRHLIESLRADYTEPRYQLDILTRMGNYYMHLGNLVEAAEQFQEALKVCEEHPAVSHWTARILDTLGLVNRRLGLLERATRYHEQALEEYQKAQVMDKAQLAAILNNICHSHALQGQYESAQSYCEESLKIREDLGVEQAIGASHSTIGELYRNRGDYERALSHYNEALRIFEPQNDPVWLARLYSFRGAVYRLLDNLEQAERDLRHSIEFNVQTEMPWEYHVLGCVLWNKNLLDEALHHFEKSMQLARAVHDVRTQFNNLVGIAEVTYTKWKASGMQDARLRDRILRCAGELEALIEAGYDFTHHYGRMQRVLGDLAFEEQRYDDALAIYAQAYALLSRREGGYGRRTFNDELQMLARRIDYLAQDHPELSIQWCQYLREQWKDESLPILHRQRLVAMCDVREISIRRRRLG